jgi:hypothetical protein
VSSGSRCEVVYPSCLVFRVNTTNRPIRVSCRDLDAWCLGPSCLVFFIDRSHLTLSSLAHFTGKISRVDGEMRCQRRRTPRRTDRFARLPPVRKLLSQHDEPTDSRLLSGSRCVVSRTVVFSILYRSITPDVILSRSFYGRDLEGRR